MTPRTEDLAIGLILGAVLGALVAAIVVVRPAGAEAYSSWQGAHIPRRGVITWTPEWVDPDFWENNSQQRFLESDLSFGSDFRRSGHDIILPPRAPTYEWQFNLSQPAWADGMGAWWSCTLPGCELDTTLSDPSPQISYAVVSGTPELINGSTLYDVTLRVVKGVAAETNVQLFSTAGAYDGNCPNLSLGVPYCAFENYRHWYNKVRQHEAPGFYGAYDGGSFVTDNTFSPCPGNWGFSAGNVDFWCWWNSNGPEPPGRVTIRPKSGYSEGYAYRTVSFAMESGDHFSVEYVVQCLTGNPCEGRLGWQGRGIMPLDSQTSSVFTVPNDGNYYICRFDSRHGATMSATNDHDQIRARLYNAEGGTQLRVDAMAIYGWVAYGNTFDPAQTQTDINVCNEV